MQTQTIITTAGTLTLHAVSACEEQCPLPSEAGDALVAISKQKGYF